MNLPTPPTTAPTIVPVLLPLSLSGEDVADWLDDEEALELDWEEDFV
jgi:hypothetical protein